jgi:thiol:disulfide interchange protein
MARTEVVNQRAIPVWLPAIAAVLLIARIVVLQLPEKKDDVKSLVEWTPISRAVKLAATTHRPILYEFSAAWCGPCREMEKQVFADPAMAAQINRRFVAVRVVDRKQEDGVNVPEVALLQRRYGVEAFPTLVIAEANGAERRRMEGFRGREAFASLLRNASRTPVR